MERLSEYLGQEIKERELEIALLKKIQTKMEREEKGLIFVEKPNEEREPDQAWIKKAGRPLGSRSRSRGRIVNETAFAAVEAKMLELYKVYGEKTSIKQASELVYSHPVNWSPKVLRTLKDCLVESGKLKPTSPGRRYWVAAGGGGR